MRETSHRLLVIYGLNNWLAESAINRNGETVGRPGFGRKTRGSVLDVMPIRYPSGDVRWQVV